jgi:cold shock CspA family protein
LRKNVSLRRPGSARLACRPPVRPRAHGIPQAILDNRKARHGGKGVFVHVCAVERAGLRDLREGRKRSEEAIADKRAGKSSAGNPSAA